MAEVNVRNILVGHGELFYAENYDYEADAPVSPAPTSPAAVSGLTFTDGLVAAFDGAADWRYVGATQEGVELAYSPEYGEVEVDQLGDAAVMFFERSSVTLNTQLAEATLENLLLAWGFEDEFLDQTTDRDTFSLGVKGADPVERSIAVVGKGAATDAGGRRERLYLGRRVVSIEGSSLALRRGENTAYPVSLRLLADPEYAADKSEYGQIIDVVRGSTPVDAPA
jgi:hypothetical protein